MQEWRIGIDETAWCKAVVFYAGGFDNRILRSCFFRS